MSNYITEIAVSHNPAEEQQLLSQTFKKIDENLFNDGTYIWYKKQAGVDAITRIQVSINDDMSDGLRKAGYNKVARDLIESQLSLWFFRGTGSSHVPIKNLAVSDNAMGEAERMKLGWERAGCNLSGVRGTWKYLWVQRAEKTFIFDLKITNSYGGDATLFKMGYIRIDQSTNSTGPPSPPCPRQVTEEGINSRNFLWYLQTTDPEGTITDLKIRTDTNPVPGYQLVPGNMNEGNPTPAYLWYQSLEGKNPVRSMLLLLNQSAIPMYVKAAINVINENINAGNAVAPRFLCFLNSE